MTLGSGGGSPKTVAMMTDTAPVTQSFSNRVLYTCPVDTIAIVSPILFSFLSPSTGDPESFTFSGIKWKFTDPLTGGIFYTNTQYISEVVPFSGSPHSGRLALYPTPSASPMYSQRYDKFSLSGSSGLGAGILLFPGEELVWGASNSYPNNTNWKLKFGLVEYGITT